MKTLFKFLTLLLVCAVPLFMSCQEEETGAAPAIERVSLVHKDSTTNSGARGETLVIFGSHLATTTAVYFNEYKAVLNVNYVQDNNIIVRIPDSAPYADVPNTLRLVTKFGEASTEFEVEQPSPIIAAFSPGVADPGSVVTIDGQYFENLVSVVFVDQKTGTETEAEIVSATGEELQVLVPDGTKASYIKVTTGGGDFQTLSSFGFNYIIFADNFNSTWQNWSWSTEFDFAATAKVKSGDYSIKTTYTGGWGGVQFYGGDLPLADYTAIKFSIFGGPGTEGKQLIATINWAVTQDVLIHEGKWTDFTFQLSDFGSPSVLNVLVFQDNGSTGVAAPYLVYFDDMGLL